MRIVDRDIAGETPNALAVITTSHESETLEEALDFLTETARPDDVFVDTCRSAVVAVVGSADWVKFSAAIWKVARNSDHITSLALGLSHLEHSGCSLP
jgi:hypothetical protein